MPLRYAGGVWGIRAHLTTKLDRRALSRNTVTDQLARGDLEYSVDQTAAQAISGPWPG